MRTVRIDRRVFIGDPDSAVLESATVMTTRLAVQNTLASLLFVGVVAASVIALLQACALGLPFLSSLSACTPQSTVDARAQLVVLANGRDDLSRRIFELERELAARQCTAIPADPTAPLTDKGWAERDLAMLYGCWNLDTTYRTRDVDTGTIRTYNQWQMCFDTRGNGTQTMRSTDGVVCEGDVTAQFAGQGLNLVEPGNLSCADGGYIHQRQIACVPAAGGRASCDTLQPETNGAAVVGFERAPPQP